MQSNKRPIHTNSGLHIKPASNFSIAYTVFKNSAYSKYGDVFSMFFSINNFRK